MGLRCDGYAEEKLRRAVRRSFCCILLLRGDPENAKTKRHLFSTHLEFASQILDVAGQSPFGPWPPANFNREFACKQSIHIEMWQVLNRYTKRNTVPMG